MDKTRPLLTYHNTSCAVSMASLSSEGSMESPVMEQEDIAVLTHDVRNFKEALGKLRRILNSDQDKQETLRVAAHERLGDVLRILRNVLEKYPALQSTELLVTAGTLIQNVKGFSYEDDSADPKEIFEAIDHLALAFSSRVSEYLMGDLDTNVSLSSSVSSKTKSCENLMPDTEGMVMSEVGEERTISSEQQLDLSLVYLEQGVEFALSRAKVWSKYAKDLMMYVEKRAHLEMEYMRNLSKLAQTVRPLINEESNLPFQSIYCTALDHDMENSNSSLVTCRLLLGSKFLEPLSIRRSEHEKVRRQLKELWLHELAGVHDAALRMRKARSVYIQRWREKDQKVPEEDTLQKALEAEAAYKASVVEANESHARLYAVKTDILQKVRQLLVDSDNIMRTITVAYFQLQHTLNTPLPVQFQTLCESSRLYEPGSQYNEAVKRLPPNTTVATQPPFTFEEYSEGSRRFLDQERKSTESIDGEDLLFQGLREPVPSSDTDSIASAASSHDADVSSSTNQHSPSHALISDLDPTGDNVAGYMSFRSSHRHSMSKAAETHRFRKLKTPSRCRECDSYVYFQGTDCSECGLACHKKCLETLAIQCGHKRLPRKMTTFGVDLGQHLLETSAVVPHIVCKCIDEIDTRGRLIKGIYRVSGVKSKVEKLCQAFENGAELVDLRDIHPNVIANVLKLYLRQLPEPLLTFRLYPEFVRIAKECPTNSLADVTTASEDLKELVRRLPSHHFLTLALLMLHLRRVSNDADVNNMPPSNLGIVFGPTLLRTAEGSASLSSLVDTVHQTRAIELMINHSDEIFNAQEVAAAREQGLKLIQPEGGGLGHSPSFMDRSKKLKEHDTSSCNISEEGDFLQSSSNLSDDELPYFLSGDGSIQTKISSELTEITTPKIFKGSLKDYQGLEGLPLYGIRAADEVSGHHKVRKSLSETSSSIQEKASIIGASPDASSINRSMDLSKKKSENEKTSEEWIDSNPVKPSPKLGDIGKSKPCGQRTESSADSDYSFESHASSSIGSRSPRDLEEASEVFIEASGVWSKKASLMGTANEGRHKLGSGDSPSSSLSHSLDESQGSDVAEELDVAIRRSMATVHSICSRTHFIMSSNIDQDNIYIPLFQKPASVQESSHTASSKISSYHCKSSSTSSHKEKQDISVKSQFIGFQEDEMNVKMLPKLMTSSIASLKGTTTQESGNSVQIKTAAVGQSNKDQIQASKQETDFHKMESTVTFEDVADNVCRDLEQKIDN